MNSQSQLAYFNVLKKLEDARARKRQQVVAGPRLQDVTCDFVNSNGQIIQTVDLKEQHFCLSEGLLSQIKDQHEYATYIGLLLLNISDLLRSQIISSHARKIPFVLDVVGIGAGLNNSQVFSILKQSAPNARVLILEARRTTSIFDELGDSFFVNSVESPATESKPYMTSNFFSGTPVQVRDYNVDNMSYVNSQVFADTIKTAFYYSQTPIVFSQAVTYVEERKDGDIWPARYKILTSSGLEVYANHIIAGTGLGEPKIMIGDEETQKLIRLHVSGGTQTLDLLGVSTPDIETVDGYLKRVSSLIEQGIEPIEDGVVAVIGGKDGSNVVIEALSGITNNLTKKGRESLRIVWVGHCSTKDDFVKQFMGNSREPWSSDKRNEVRYNRYSGIIPLLEAGKIKTMPGHLESIRPIDAFDDLKKPKQRYEITVDGKRTIVDRIIIAAGYQNKVENIFRQFSSLGAKREFADTSDYTPNLLQHGSFPVARKYQNQDVWIVGAACEKWSDDNNRVIETRDLVLTEGGGSAGILGSRSAAVGRMVAQLVRSIDSTKVSLIQLVSEYKAEFAYTHNKFKSKEQSVAENGNPAVLQIENKIGMARLFNKFRIQSISETRLDLEISMTEIVIKGISYTSCLALIEKLLEDIVLERSLGALLAGGYSVKLGLISRKEGGTFRTESMEHYLVPSKHAPDLIIKGLRSVSLPRAKL